MSSLVPLVVLGGVMVGGCEGADAPGESSASASDSGAATEPVVAGLRWAHLAPDLGAVAWSVDGAPVGDGEYLDGAPYLDMDPGSHTVTATLAADDTLVAEIDVSLEEAGTYATAVLYGTAGKVVLAKLDDDLSPLFPGGRRTQLMHVGDGLGEVDLFDTLYEDFEVISDLSFGEVGPTFEAPVIAVQFGLDVDDDGAVDLNYTFPAWPGGTLVDVFVVSDETGVRLAGLRQDGGLDVVDAD